MRDQMTVDGNEEETAEGATTAAHETRITHLFVFNKNPSREWPMKKYKIPKTEEEGGSTHVWSAVPRLTSPFTFAMSIRIDGWGTKRGGRGSSVATLGWARHVDG